MSYQFGCIGMTNKNHKNAPDSSINKGQTSGDIALRIENDETNATHNLKRSVSSFVRSVTLGAVLAYVASSSLNAQGREVFVPVQLQDGTNVVDVVTDGTKNANPLLIPLAPQTGQVITDIIASNGTIYYGLKNIDSTWTPTIVVQGNISTMNSQGTPNFIISINPQTLSAINAWGIPTAADILAVTPDGYLCTATAASEINPGVVKINTTIPSSDFASVFSLPNQNVSTAAPLYTGTQAIGTNPGTCYFVSNGVTAMPGVGFTVVSMPTNSQGGFIIPVKAPAASNMSITPDGTKAYLSTMGSVTIIDFSTNQQIGKILLPGNASTYAGNVVFSPDGTHAYAATGPIGSTTQSSRLIRRASLAGYISEINTATEAVTQAYLLGNASATPAVLSMSPDGSKVWSVFTDGSNIQVEVVPTATNSLGTPLSTLLSQTRRITLTDFYEGSQSVPSLKGVPITFSQDGTKAYYAHGSTVYTIDTSTYDFVSTPLDGNAIGSIATATTTK